MTSSQNDPREEYLAELSNSMECASCGLVSLPHRCPKAGDTLSEPVKDEINSPAHYRGGDPYETIKVLEAWLTSEEFRGFLKGNLLKYHSRAWLKGAPLADTRKAGWSQNRLEQHLSKMTEPTPLVTSTIPSFEANGIIERRGPSQSYFEPDGADESVRQAFETAYGDWPDSRPRIRYRLLGFAGIDGDRVETAFKQAMLKIRTALLSIPHSGYRVIWWRIFPETTTSFDESKKQVVTCIRARLETSPALPEEIWKSLEIGDLEKFKEVL